MSNTRLVRIKLTQGQILMNYGLFIQSLSWNSLDTQGKLREKSIKSLYSTDTFLFFKSFEEIFISYFQLQIFKMCLVVEEMNIRQN